MQAKSVKIVIKDINLVTRDMFNEKFNQLVSFYRRYSALYPVNFIKIVSADGSISELHKDKYNNIIYREYEKN